MKSNIFVQENALEHVVCEVASILSRPQCVNNLFQLSDTDPKKNNSMFPKTNSAWLKLSCISRKWVYASFELTFIAMMFILEFTVGYIKKNAE